MTLPGESDGYDVASELEPLVKITAPTRSAPLAFGALPHTASPITIEDCGTRSQLLTVEALVSIGVEVVLVERGEGITRPLRIQANGHAVDVLPTGRPEVAA